MFDPSELQVIPYAEWLLILTELIDTGNDLDALKLGLFQNDVVPTPLSVLADLTPCDFDGYAIFSPVVWGTPYYDVDGQPIVLGGEKTFLCTGSTTPNTVYGWYLTDSGAARLVKASRFTTPYGISGPSQAVPVVPWVKMPG